MTLMPAKLALRSKSAASVMVFNFTLLLSLPLLAATPPTANATNATSITTVTSSTNATPVYNLPPATQKIFANMAGMNDRLTFSFQHVDIRTLLQLIAKHSGLNFIINDAVKGDVSLNLKDVTWQQALDIVLKTQNLAARRVGNVMYISTLDDITGSEAKQLNSETSLANLAPLKSVLLRLNYTTATDIAKLIKGEQSSLLTPRGQVAVDSRTNSLIIRDTKESLDDIIPEIKKLDIPAKQVLIEARIVNIDITYEEELGVRFGVNDSRHLAGTLSGANQFNQGINAANVNPLSSRLNFNVPANQLFDGQNAGSVGLALARVGHILLDLELSALEGENKAQVVARPRVVTSNQQKAVIQTGEEIPYQEATSSGATSVTFKKAVLSLEIIPQITPDRKIVLRLKATEDTRGANVTVGTSSTNTPITIPAINTQEVESNILLNNNETIVLGGVYKTNKVNTFDRVPFLGTLPYVGTLFSHQGVHDEKHELLIFITPKILNNGPIKAFDDAFNTLKKVAKKGTAKKKIVYKD